MYETLQAQEANLGALVREVEGAKGHIKALKKKLAEAPDEKAVAWAEEQIKKQERVLAKAQECLAEVAGEARVRSKAGQKRGPGRPPKNDSDPED